MSNPYDYTTSVTCLNCEKGFEKRTAELKKYPNSYCSLKCKNEYKTKTQTTKLICEVCGEEYIRVNAMAEKSRFCSRKCQTAYKGKDNLTPLNGAVRMLKQNLDWKKEVFERDGYMCKNCGDSEYIHAHHIKTFSIIMMENNIRTKEQAISCEELWDVNNGITLCPDCHKEAHYNATLKIA